jgi:P27 family predicted phage terminase small subunit
MRGRRPKPTHLKIVAGNPGKRALNYSEPKPKRALPKPPADISDDARVVWNRFASFLHKNGVLTELDVLALRQLCEAYADYQRAKAVLEAFGSHYYESVSREGSVMYRAHPAVADMKDADRRFKAWLAEFGATPSARSRVTAVDTPDDDPADDYFA